MVDIQVGIIHRVLANDFIFVFLLQLQDFLIETALDIVVL